MDSSSGSQSVARVARRARALRTLYLVNAALLVVHELDSTFWREWELFGLPGGEPGFLLLHVPLVALVVWGYERLAAGARAGLRVSLVLAGAGLLAPALHGLLLGLGRPEFRAPASLAVLAATGLVSAVQLVASLGVLRAGDAVTAASTPTTPGGAARG